MSISEKAVIVKFKVGLPTGHKTDRGVASEIDQIKGANGAGRYTKILLTKEDLAGPNTVYSASYAYFQKMTLPWEDGGWRILPNALFFEFQETMREFKGKYQKSVDDINLEAVKTRAEKRLGTMYREDEMPSKEDLRRAFYFDWDFWPIPESGDFRIDASKEHADVLREQAERQLASKQKEALESLWFRLRDELVSLKERIDEGTRLNARSLGGIKRALEILPKLNVFGDSQLEDVGNQVLTEISGWEMSVKYCGGDGIREKVEDILSKMAGVF